MVGTPLGIGGLINNRTSKVAMVNSKKEAVSKVKSPKLYPNIIWN